jgi:hypothetical protein
MTSRDESTKETNFGSQRRGKVERSQIAKQANQRTQLAAAIGKLTRLEDRMTNMGQQLEDAQKLLSKPKSCKVHEG